VAGGTPAMPPCLVRPSLLFLVGPAAAGKMTVGMEVCRLTGMRLLHNHMTIDLVQPFFHFGTPAFYRLVEHFRTAIVEEVASSDLPGIVFTYVWAFDEPGEAEIVQGYARPFASRGLPIRFVELQADQSERLRRNRTALRLEHKRPKRDLEWSDADLLQMDRDYQLSAPPALRERPNWLLVDNTHLTAEQAAQRIVEHLELPLTPRAREQGATGRGRSETRLRPQC